MSLKAETGQPVPPARRALVPRYPTWRAPAVAAVHSPPLRGEGAFRVGNPVGSF